MRSSQQIGGQPVLVPSAALQALTELEDRLAGAEACRSAEHAGRLRDVRAFAAAAEAAGIGMGAAAQLALVLSCSQWRANDLLAQARVLDALPSGLAQLDSGRLTVEQAGVVVRILEPLAPADAELVWTRLLRRLEAERARGIAHPPARLAELLRRLVAELLPTELAEQRRRNAVGDDVTYDQNDDGTANLHVLGVSGPNAQAALSRIAARSAPWGPEDERTEGQRRRDAAVDLLTGRVPLPCPQHPEPTDGPPEPVPATTCGCPAGSSVPCGADVQVLVPLATALGLSDVPAELVGAGPLDHELLTALLTNAPSLRPAFVDAHGVPVAVGRRTATPARDDAGSLRQALLDLARSPVGERFPVHPHDHPPPTPPGDDCPPGEPHPPDDTGPYGIRPQLRRLLGLRSVRCEWPGCGARAARCDLDHDRAWPHGPTCSCNLGALCRHHHRVKQLGWTKTRLPDGSVRWTSPTGRTATSPPQLPPVPQPVRALPPTGTDERTPLEREVDERLDRPWDAAWEDTRRWSPPDPEHDPLGDTDRTGDALRTGSTRWTLDLQDPYRWDGEPRAG